MKCARCTAFIFCTIIAVIFFSCGKSDPAGPSQSSINEIWFAGVDSTAKWVDIDDMCNIRIPATKPKADSVCQARGYNKAAGYDPLDCYVGGVKETFMECVACTYKN